MRPGMAGNPGQGSCCIRWEIKAVADLGLSGHRHEHDSKGTILQMENRITAPAKASRTKESGNQ